MRRGPAARTAWAVAGAGTAGAALWLPRLLRLRRSVAEHARYWSVPRGEPGGLLYVALGDSAAQGIGATSPEVGYVGLLAATVREATARPVQVVNLSRSGAKVADLVTGQLPRLAALRPDLVTVDIGGNDIRRYDDAAFRRDVVRLVDRLPAGTIVADIPYFGQGRFERDATRAAAFITEQAQAHGLVVARLHEAMRDRGWRAVVTDYAADLFHPNDRGHRVWAASFQEVLPDGLRP